MSRFTRTLDSWRFWTLVAWVALALLVIWLVVLNSRLEENIDDTDAALAAQAEAIAFLCDTNAIIQALAGQTVKLLQSEEAANPDPTRRVTITVFRGYVDVLEQREACVNAERAVIP